MSIKVTRKIGDAIDLMRAKGLRNSEIVENHNDHNHLRVDGWDSVQQLGIGELCDALYIGYEVEETPEEIVRKNYSNVLKNIEYLSGGGKAEYWKGVNEGVISTLKTLNIKIEGVNA